MRVKNLLIIICIVFTLLISMSCFCWAAVNVKPTITFSPASGSSISTSDSVIIKASDPDDKVTSLNYKWDLDAYTNISGSTITLIPPSAGMHTLTAYATDRRGNSCAEFIANYNVAAVSVQEERVSVAMSPTSGIVALAGTGGVIKLYNTQGHFIRNTNWHFADPLNDTKNIYAGGSFKNGYRIFVGENGQYCITESSANPHTDPTILYSGIWTTNGYNPSINAVVPICNSGSGFSENEMLMVGSQGEWQVINDTAQLSDAQKGTAGMTGVTAAAGLSDGRVVMIGEGGTIGFIDTDRDDFIGSEYWTKSSADGGGADNSEIYAVLPLDDNSIVFAGKGGKIQIRTPGGTWHEPIKWEYSGDITSLSILPNGNFLAAGTNGYFQVIKLNEDHSVMTYGTADDGQKGRYLTLSGTVSAGPFVNGRIILVGKNAGFELYKLHKYDAIEVVSTTVDSVTLHTVFDKVGFDNGILDMSTNGGAYVTKINSFSGDTVTVTGLTPGTYKFRVRRLMYYPIYYNGEGDDAEAKIEIPPQLVSVSSFTDRVTAANKWIDENDPIQVAKFGKYMLDSEVVCRFDIDPAGRDIENYNITFNADNSNNQEIGIQYIKIVKMVIGEGPTAQTINSDNINISNSNLETITFNTNTIADTSTNKVSIYVKYRFKKLHPSQQLTSAEKQLENEVIITSKEKVTLTENTTEGTNDIYIMDVKAEIR